MEMMLGGLLGLSIFAWLGYQLVRNKQRAQADASAATTPPPLSTSTQKVWRWELPFVVVPDILVISLWWILLPPAYSPLEYWRTALVLLLGVGLGVYGFRKKWSQGILVTIAVVTALLFLIGLYADGQLWVLEPQDDFEKLIRGSLGLADPAATKGVGWDSFQPSKVTFGVTIAALGIAVLLGRWLSRAVKSNGGSLLSTGAYVLLGVGVALTVWGLMSTHTWEFGVAAPKGVLVPTFTVRTIGYVLLSVAVLCSLVCFPVKGLKNSFIWTTVALVGVVLVVGPALTVDPILDEVNAVLAGKDNPNPKALWWLLVPVFAYSTYLGAKDRLGPLTAVVVALGVAAVLFPDVFTMVTGLMVDPGPWLTGYGGWLLIGILIVYLVVAT